MSKIEIEGTYAAKVKEVKLGESQKGNPRIEIFLETTDEKETQYIGTDLYLTEAAIVRTDEQLREVFGFDGVYENLEAQIVGKPCSIVCEEERRDDGSRLMRVKWLNSPRAPRTPIKNEEDFRKQLTSRFARGHGGKASSTEQPSLPSNDDGDDCPF